MRNCLRISGSPLPNLRLTTRAGRIEFIHVLLLFVCSAHFVGFLRFRSVRRLKFGDEYDNPDVRQFRIIRYPELTA